MNQDSFDILILGGGHAGCEAALAAARMGKSVGLVTLKKEAIGRMSCNPAIGGLAKGHLVREIDALGGEMAKVTDQTAIQFRMLNTTKGPAVWAPRAQCDKYQYQKSMQSVVENQYGITVIEEMGTELLATNNIIHGVRTQNGLVLKAKVVVITTGTFLNGLMHTGEKTSQGGRVGEQAAVGLTDSLVSLGFLVGRLKTGTPPRLDKDSIDFNQTFQQLGDPEPQPFSYENESVNYKQVPCYITYTNEKTKKVIQDNLHRSPMYTGKIIGIGPRYCPSIEDKIIRFADKERHQIFLEPESLSTNEIYVNGCSTSLPHDVQEDFIHSIPGLENAKFLRHGYAVEYDFVFPYQVLPTLETHKIKNLFLAGQINGTSGYEEAAAQGFVAGVNAALNLDQKEPFILDRSQGYMGVLVDDLVTKSTEEPYRMFTSRAEYRLLLRQDNADLRLTEIGYRLGLIGQERFERFQEKRRKIQEEVKRLKQTFVGNQSLAQLLRRPELRFPDIQEVEITGKLPDEVSSKVTQTVKNETPEENHLPCAKPHQDLKLTPIERQVEIQIKYEGYIDRQLLMIEKFKRFEEKKIPVQFNYDWIPGLSTEGRQKLVKMKPVNLGHASRISGVSPADITVLLVWLERGLKALKQRQKNLPLSPSAAP